MDEPLDLDTLKILKEEGIDPAKLRLRDGAAPYTSAGLPSLRTYEVPELAGANTRGFVVNSPLSSKNPRTLSQAVFVAPKSKPDIQAHEIEHLLARQNLGSGSELNSKFDALTGNKSYRTNFAIDAVDNAPYLKSKYGLSNAYFDHGMLDKWGGALLYEQLATLAGYEAANNVDLTKDPVLRKSLFKDKAVREAYNAITGLRQTRLDARDLPPYTRQPEPETTTLDKLKKLLKFAEGGYVPNAGGRKKI